LSLIDFLLVLGEICMRTLYGRDMFSRKDLLLIVGLVVVASLLYWWNQQRTFEVRSVDAMAWTQDRVMPEVQPDDAFIEQFVILSQALGATHIALSVPYDDPPGTPPGTSIEYLRRWLKPIRDTQLKVWFRMSPVTFKNFYEAGYDYRLDAHIATIERFILTYPELIEPGDIFTPVPEPQADQVRGINCEQECLFDDVDMLVGWMEQATYGVLTAFEVAGIEGVEVGRWGLDGFVLWGDRNPEWEQGETIEAWRQRILLAEDGYVCPDHYFPYQENGQVVAPQKELKKIRQAYPRARFWICEWGAIEDQPPSYVKHMMQAALDQGVTGFNYWQAGPAGPESLFRFNDAGELEPTAHYDVVKHFYRRLRF
jgi:hypothetical protein